MGFLDKWLKTLEDSVNDFFPPVDPGGEEQAAYEEKLRKWQEEVAAYEQKYGKMPREIQSAAESSMGRQAGRRPQSVAASQEPPKPVRLCGDGCLTSPRASEGALQQQTTPLFELLSAAWHR